MTIVLELLWKIIQKDRKKKLCFISQQDNEINKGKPIIV